MYSMEVKRQSFLSVVLYSGELLAWPPGRFTSQERTSVTHWTGVGWASGSLWTPWRRDKYLSLAGTLGHELAVPPLYRTCLYNFYKPAGFVVWSVGEIWDREYARQKHLFSYLNLRRFSARRSKPREFWLLISAPFVNFSIPIGCTLRILFLVVLFLVTAQKIFEAAAPDFIAGTAVTLYVLADPVKDSWRVLSNFARN